MNDIIISNNQIPYKHNFHSVKGEKIDSYTIKLTEFPEIIFRFNYGDGYNIEFCSDISKLQFCIGHGLFSDYSTLKGIYTNQVSFQYFKDEQISDWFGKNTTYHRLWNHNYISIFRPNNNMISLQLSFCVNHHDTYGWDNFSDEIWECVLIFDN